MQSDEQSVLGSEEIDRILRRMAFEIVERTRGVDRLALIGIRRGGVPVARRLAREIQQAEGEAIPVGTVDITLYRDDAATALPNPKIGPSEVPFELAGLDVVLVDDVLHTGRTIRAALDCLLDYGRPRRVWLAVLCDRGDRELPIAADFVGRSIEVPEGDLLQVVVDDDEAQRAFIRRWHSRFPPPPEGTS